MGWALPADPCTNICKKFPKRQITKFMKAVKLHVYGVYINIHTYIYMYTFNTCTCTFNAHSIYIVVLSFLFRFRVLCKNTSYQEEGQLYHKQSYSASLGNLPLPLSLLQFPPLSPSLSPTFLLSLTPPPSLSPSFFLCALTRYATCVCCFSSQRRMCWNELHHVTKVRSQRSGCSKCPS